MRNNKAFVFGLAISALCFTACGGGKMDNMPEVEQLDNTVILNIENEEVTFDPYTEIQKNYLNDEYKNIGNYGNGNKEQSKPLKYELTWNVDDFDGKYTFSRFEIQLDEDVTIGQDRRTYSLDANARSISFNNLKVGTKYHVSIAAFDGDKAVGIDNRLTLETTDKEVRFIDIDGLSNVRDCGGWHTIDGKRIKQGLLYRGEELNQQNYGKNGGSIDPDDAKEREKEKPYGQKITATGIDTFVNELGIKCEVDIRGYENFDWATNRNESPTECGGLKEGNGIIQDIKYTISPVHTSRDKIYYDDYGKAAVKNFFSLLADEETNLPLYFHCAQGKDRTGFLAYLFEAFMGVPEENLMRDYLLSNLGKTGSVSVSKLVGSSSQYNYVDYLNGKEVSTQSNVKYQAEGSTIKERATNYLLSCGLTEAQLETIEETFTDSSI